MYKIHIVIELSLIILTSALNCKLPFGCEINTVQCIMNFNGYEKTSWRIPGILCDIRNEKYQFNYTVMPLLKPDVLCEFDSENIRDIIEFRFHNSFILDKQFNFMNFVAYTSFFLYYLDANFVNLNGFELDIIDKNQNISYYIEQDSVDKFYFINSKIEFYSNGRQMKTCQDIIDSYPDKNISIRSLFQIQGVNNSNKANIALVYSEFRTALCPLVFNNSRIRSLYIVGLANTFFKRNLLNIENRTFDGGLNSKIEYLNIKKEENLNIDSNLLNPSVFRKLNIFQISGPVNTIDGKSFKALKNLKEIRFSKTDFRDMIHKNGIEWMRDLNSGLNVNLSDFEELKKNYHRKIRIDIGVYSYMSEIRLSKVLPDRDFCLYENFPFNQLVILIEIAYQDRLLPLLNSSHYSCTYLWLAKYFHYYHQVNQRLEF